jgi:hypothetical protein
MAEFVLAVLVVHTPPVGSTLVAGDTLAIKWDDVGEDIVVYKNNVLDATPYTIGVLTDNYTFIYGISSYEGLYAISVYSFCDDNDADTDEDDLNWFRMAINNPTYPYFSQQVTIDSPVCAIGGGPVCDIIFNAPAKVTHATNLSGDNGQIIVSAVSGNGLVKYALFDFDYFTEGQTSGTITDLAPGEYTVYAKDTNGCTAINTLTVLYRPAVAEHYRFTWDDIHQQRVSRVRIYEREYIGDVVEVTNGGGEAFRINKPLQEDGFNKKFYPLHPTSAVLSLMSRVNFQYLPLYTQDPKKYLCVYEVDEGSGFDAQGSWFIAPSAFNEVYAAPPYVSSFQLTDNLKSLQKTLFTDLDGNLLNGTLKLIKVLSFILKRTGLELNIRSGINIFEAAHNTTAADDPLDQTYIDVACYRNETEPFTCWEVLEAILMPFGARLFQQDNMWVIEEIDRAKDGYAYRVFDAEGDYLSNSSVNPIIDIVPSGQAGPSFSGRNHSLEIIPAYGKITVKSKLNYTGAMVAGGFEKSDLINPESETLTNSAGVFASEEGFKDWTLRQPSGISGVSFGRVQIDNRSVGAFYYNLNSWSGNLRNSYIESSSKPFQYKDGDEIRLTFEHSSPAPAEFEFMVLRVMLRVGTGYLQEDLSWDSVEHIYRIYAKPGSTSGVIAPTKRTTRSTEPEQFREIEEPKNTASLQKFELTVPVPDPEGTTVDTTIQVRIYFYAPLFYDYGSPATSNDPDTGSDGLSDLKDLATVDIDYNYNVDVRRHFDFGLFTGYERHFYILRYSDKAEDDPDIIRPDDFHATDNPKVWYSLKSIIDNAVISGNGRGSIVKFLVDNVGVDSLPGGQEPPEEDVIEYTISKFINEDLEIELYNSDLPDISNGKNIYNNYFRLSNGTPTATWARSGITEEQTLQEILLEILAANHSAPTFRLTGSFVNKFGRIKVGSYLRLTKEGSDISLSNTLFTSDLSDWEQSADGEAFAWTADNSGSAEVLLNGSVDSNKLFQYVTHQGGFIQINANIHTIPTAGNEREDNLYVLFYSGGSIIHQERLKSFLPGDDEEDIIIAHKAFLPTSCDAIGFFFKFIEGDGECIYQVGDFAVDGVDILDVYQIADYAFSEKSNIYTFELLQISKPYLSLDGIDTGGTGQDPGVAEYGIELEDESGLIEQEADEETIPLE